MFGRRILVLAAHPDDEVVAYAAAIGRAQAAGAEVFALYLTHGCLARETLWPWQRKHYAAKVARRHLEAKEVAKRLNITPVGFSELPARHLWRNATQVFDEIQKVLAAHAIDQLWIPAYEGGNADHDGLNGICARIPLREKENGILEFAEYNYTGGRVHSQEFPSPNGTETVLYLTPQEQKFKRELLALYASEKQNLNYVETQREFFRPLALYDYAKPPHEGTLWYARFQWVPFRHPRVDFTSPIEVCESITGFVILKTTSEP